MDCEKCGGACWDNRSKNTERIAAGKKPMPEYTCKDKDGCGWLKWPPRQAGQSGGGKAAVVPRGPKWTWKELSTLYSNSLKLAAKHVAATLPKALPADVVAAGATIFIAATRDGVKSEESLSDRPSAFVAKEDEELEERFQKAKGESIGKLKQDERMAQR